MIAYWYGQRRVSRTNEPFSEVFFFLAGSAKFLLLTETIFHNVKVFTQKGKYRLLTCKNNHCRYESYQLTPIRNNWFYYCISYQKFHIIIGFKRLSSHILEYCTKQTILWHGVFCLFLRTMIKDHHGDWEMMVRIWFTHGILRLIIYQTSNETYALRS